MTSSRTMRVQRAPTTTFRETSFSRTSVRARRRREPLVDVGGDIANLRPRPEEAGRVRSRAYSTPITITNPRITTAAVMRTTFLEANPRTCEESAGARSNATIVATPGRTSRVS